MLFNTIDYVISADCYYRLLSDSVQIQMDIFSCSQLLFLYELES